MKYLVIDTETTGLFDFKKPADEAGQPRLANVHFIYADENGALVEAKDYIVKPDDTWTDEDFKNLERPENPNPLTKSILEEKGVPIADILKEYTEAIKDKMLILVAHNANFDTKVMRAELRRAEMDDLYGQTAKVCTMLVMTKICKIQGPRGYKWPKLAEALEYIGEKLENAHSADADTEGARKLLAWLLKNNPEVVEPKTPTPKKDNAA